MNFVQSRMKTFQIIFLFIFLQLYGCNNQIKDTTNRISVAEAMGDFDTTGYLRAFEQREFIFPRDHGPHPGYRIEWWYITGNLETPDGRKFGYQFTIFRNEMSSDSISSENDWATNQIYMGHFAITDINNNRFYYDERFSRGSAGIAGAESTPLRIWIEDWEISAQDDTVSKIPQLKLIANTSDFGLTLNLKSLKPLVLQGDRGLSQKSAEPGNASYYYSLTRFESKGTVTIIGVNQEVNGYSWMDREWSTSALGEDQEGWDWFSLQLDDNREIMYYQLRKKDGSIDEYSKGIFVREDGTSLLLKFGDVILDVTNNWTSNTNSTYPSEWKFEIPSENISLLIKPAIQDQELDVSVKYWEGAVTISGSHSGRGYVELTGY